MAKYYSPSTKGFYDDALGIAIPSDAKTVSDSDYAALFAAQASGKIIQPNANGSPEAVLPTVTIADQAMGLLAVGCQITSISMSALNGTYPADAASQQHVQAEITSILLNSAFADGNATIQWQDTSAAEHTFTVAQFKTFATALAAFVSGCLKCVNGQSTTLPTQPVTIA